MSNDYEPLEIIGKGSYGTVRKVRNKLDNSILVRKEIEYKSMNAQERNQIISELRILKELNHNNIVRYYRHDHIIASRTIHIYMEYCSGGDLSQLIKDFKHNDENVPEEFIWQVLVQTLSALYRCHYGSDAPKVELFKDAAHGGDDTPQINSESVIIHRDIKPDNIFLERGVIKVGDFGLAKMLTTSNDFAKTYVGTPYYMSPEVLMDEPYSPVCDVWSLGCVLYELCNQHPPFQAKTHLQLQAKIKRGTIPPISDFYSVQLRSIIRECITVDPELRPTCYDLINSLSIKFLRKEMELKEYNQTLSSLKHELINKSEELKKKDQFIQLRETRCKEKELKLSERESKISDKENHLHKIENTMIEEFNLKKQALVLEAKEVRLAYQKEFWSVVEKEVNDRLKSRPRGPRDFEDMNILRMRNLNTTSETPKFRVTDEYERQKNMEIRKYRIN